MLVQAEIWTVAHTEEGNAVLVRPIGSDLAVPIFIGQAETQSLLIGLGDVPMPRPLTHDLIIALLNSLNAVLSRIEINDLKDNTFFAKLILGKGNEEIIVDARPSDALALAVRQKCPVYIAESIIDAAGVSIDLVMDISARDDKQNRNGGEIRTPPLSDQESSLLEELERAVEAEDYERAAVIRDILNGKNDSPRDDAQ